MLKTVFRRFAVRIADGSPMRQAVGFVLIATRRNFFIIRAARCGIHLKRAANVRAVITNGVGLRVCDAAVGRVTNIGMRKKKFNFYVMDEQTLEIVLN